nr:retrovirus-related Pol polyprotein from transposon TNT 1-94 [Tanacetum cinerariifolium]
IDNEIYSTVDACSNACEMWKEIKRLKQGESINVQDLETNLYWEFRKFTSRMRAERIARVANPFALVAQQQPVYHPQNHPTHYTQNSSTRSQQAATWNRGKDNSLKINRSVGYENKRIGNVSRARENVGSSMVQKSGIQCYNCKEFGHVARECQKPKRAKDAAYHREKMLLYQELEAHYMYMAQLQEVSPDAADSGPIFDDEPMNDQIAPILRYGDLVQRAATSSQAWLWHRRLSHLNFDPINLLSKNDIVVGLPKLKFVKDHLCSSCELGKAKRNSFYTKLTPSSKRLLQLLHMDLCGPIWVASINGKRYVLVIIYDYSRYTWTHFLRSKDETPEVLIDFLRLVQRGLQAQVRVVRTDKGTEFLNQTLHAYFTAKGILHQTFVARTPKQNGVVKRRNCTLVEAARTMLSAAKVPLFFWDEAISTACFTQNRSLVIPRHEKTPYHIINDRKP